MEADHKTPPAGAPRLPVEPGPENGDDHDRSLIVERLSWTPAQRLDANTAFLRFYLSARPDGPLITGER